MISARPLLTTDKVRYKTETTKDFKAKNLLLTRSNPPASYFSPSYKRGIIICFAITLITPLHINVT